MGLLSKAWNVVDPFLPDEQVMGLLGRFGGEQPRQDVTGYQPPQAAPLAPMRQGPGIGRYIEGFIGGKLPGAVRDDYDANVGAAEQRRAMFALAKEAGLSPQELLAMILNGKEFGKSLGTNSEAANVSGGDSRTMRGRTFTAPKLTDHQGVYGTQTQDGYTPTGQALPSTAEETAMFTAEETAKVNALEVALKAQGIELDQAKLRELVRHNKQTEGIGWKNANRPVGGGGSGGSLPPGFKLD